MVNLRHPQKSPFLLIKNIHIIVEKTIIGKAKE